MCMGASDKLALTQHTASLGVALGVCLVELRAALRTDVECLAVMDAGGPDLTTLLVEDRARLQPRIDAIRRAQELVGKPADGQPRWVDWLVEGLV